MPYYHAHAALDGIPVVLGRTGWTGEVGYEIDLLDPERGDDLWDRVMEAGAPHDIWPIAPCEPRRIEAGIFIRSDMTLDDNPFEVTGLERLVEEQEADYIGMAALERIRAEGVTRKLVGMEVDGDALDWELNGDRAGHATVAIHSPGLKKNIGYVWVPIEPPSRARTSS